MVDDDVETRTLAEQETAVVGATLPVAEVGPWLAGVFAEVAAYLERKGAGPVGMPFARYHRLAGGRLEVEAGFAATTPIGGEGDIEPSDLPGGPAVVTVHTGPYDEIAGAYSLVQAWLAAHDAEPAGDAWEVYLTDPATEPDPAVWRTEVVQPYRPRS